MGLLDFFTKTIGIDPGSQNLRIIKDGELIFDESAQLSIDALGKVTGIGNSVKVTKTDHLIKPVNYVPKDFYGFEMLQRGAVKKGLNKRDSILQNSLIIYYCIPSNASEVDKRAYRDSGEHANGKEVYLIHQCCTSAIGMGILLEKKDFVLIDFGASKTEITVFANSGPISQGIILCGTWKLFRMIKNYILRTHKLVVSDSEVEEILRTLEVKGLKEELKVQFVKINQSEFQNTIILFIAMVKDELLETIERVTSHPKIDRILNNGFYITGGGSLNAFLCEQILPGKDVKCQVSRTPLLDNVNGLKKVISKPIDWKGYLMS